MTALKFWFRRGMMVERLTTVFLMVALPSALILLILSGLRHSRRRLRLGQSVAAVSAAEGFQFTIRQLLVMTAIAAVVLAAGRGVGHLPTTDDFWQATVAFAVVGPYFILLELATLWGALSIRRPFPRLLIVLPTAFVVGAIPPVYLTTPLWMSLDWKDFIAWSCFMGLQATIMAVSLLVVRTCGWRLWRMKSEPVFNQSTPYDEPLAERLRQLLAERLEEKKFVLDGIRFLLNGNMCVGVWKNSLIARLGPQQGAAALKQKHVTQFDVTGEPMPGLVLVAPVGIGHDDQLNDWLRRAEEFVATLPPK
jgi:hypothetical protein